jgi:AcrR family transcriptional regulator
MNSIYFTIGVLKLATLLQTKGDQAIEEILTAAKHLFLAHGYNGTSMRVIAQEAGDRSVAGLYNHFRTKQAIFEALFHQANPYEEMLSALEAIQADTAPDFIEATLRIMMQVMTEHYDFIQLVQIDQREFQGATMRQVAMPMLPRGFAFIERLQSLPGLKPEEAIFFGRFIGSVIIGYVLTQHLAPRGLFESWSVEEWIAKFAQFVVYGVAGQEKRAEG